MNELRGKPHLWILLGLIGATLAVYGQVAYHDFVNFDDLEYVIDNIHIQHGITAESITWALTSGYASNWHPLTWISHMLDYKLWGLNPGAFLITNMCLHILSTLLLFHILNRMTGALWKSAFVAAMFALHPLHIESVAWVSERKDVLSAFFWMLTMWGYLRYVERPGLARYSLVLLFFAFGLMAKPMLVTLPFVFLLMDYWPLQRLSFGQQARPTPSQKKKPTGGATRGSIISLVREKIPLFALVLASSIVTYIVQQKGGAVAHIQALPLGNRIPNAIVSYIMYLKKMIWPSDLAIFYPYSRDLPPWQVGASAILLIVVFLFAFRAIRRYPYVTMGWLWYVGTLVPVIGIIQVGNQSMADRYTYIPLIGIFVILAWGIPELLRNWPPRKLAIAITGSTVVTLAAVSTWFQVKHWQDSFALYEHALEVTTNNDLAHNNLGAALFNKGKYDEAVEHYKEALKLTPLNADALNNLGLTLAKQKNFDEALANFNEALRAKPNFAQAHANLGVALTELGRYDEAIQHNREALRLKPDYIDAYNNLGSIYGKLGRTAEAIDLYTTAARLLPNNADAYSSIAFLLASQGKYAEAIPPLTEAVRITPENADRQTNLGNLLLMQGRIDEALTHLREAVRLNPELPLAHQGLASALSKQEKYDEAVKEYTEALRLNPNDPQSHFGIGVALAKQGKIGDATSHLTEALRLKPDYAEARTELDKLQKPSRTKQP